MTVDLLDILTKITSVPRIAELPMFLKQEFLPDLSLQGIKIKINDETRQARFSFSTGNCRKTASAGPDSGKKRPALRFSDDHVFFKGRIGSFKVRAILAKSSTADLLTKEAWSGLLDVFFNHVLLLLQIEELETALQHDDLTSLLNQNTLKSLINQEIEQNRLLGTVFSLVFLDIDGLKDINESFGHLTGSNLLKEFAEILGRALRKCDVVARFGGDEFVFLLMRTDEQKALQVCSRLSEMINRHRFLASRGLNLAITVSFGITACRKDDQDAETIIRRADQAMYMVKRKGKNGIQIFRENINGNNV